MVKGVEKCIILPEFKAIHPTSKQVLKSLVTTAVSNIKEYDKVKK